MRARQRTVSVTFLLIVLLTVCARNEAQAIDRWPPWQSYGEAEQSARAHHKRAPKQAEIDALNRKVEELRAAGKGAEAIPVAARALALTERRHGANDAATAAALTTLADLLIAQNRLKDAEPLLKRALAIREKAKSGGGDVAQALDNLAALYVKEGRETDAKPLRERSGALRGKPQDKAQEAAKPAEKAREEAARQEAARQEAARKAEAEAAREQAARQQEMKAQEAAKEKLSAPPAAAATPPAAAAPKAEESSGASPAGGAMSEDAIKREAEPAHVHKKARAFARKAAPSPAARGGGAPGPAQSGAAPSEELAPAPPAAEAAPMAMPPPDTFRTMGPPVPATAPASPSGGSAAATPEPAPQGAQAPAAAGPSEPSTQPEVPEGGGGGGIPGVMPRLALPPSTGVPMPAPPPGLTPTLKPGAGPAPALIPPPAQPAPPAAAVAPNPNPPAAAAAKKDQTGWDVVPVFYGTDRAEEPNPKRISYSSDRGHRLELGRALVTVPKIHEVPQVERPWAIRIPYFDVTIYQQAEDPNKHFTMQEIKKLSKEDFLKLVRARLGGSQRFKDQALVFVHGYNTSFDNAVYRTAQIAYDLKFDGAPFLYSWPSGGAVASYTYDRESAEASRPYMRKFLDLVVKETGAKKVSIIAHSMGNQPLLDVLKDMKAAAPEGVEISQVILAAPDVDADSFAELAQAIKGLAKGVTLYAASNDRALEVSRNFWGHYRAGDVPASGPLVIPGVDTIDVTALSTDAFAINHSDYAQKNELLKDIGELLLTGLRPPDERALRPERVKSAKGAYWRYEARSGP